MPSSRRNQLAFLASALLAAVPVAFGLIRAVSTGDDLRYLWMAGAAFLGATAVIVLRRGAADPARVSRRRAVGAMAGGATCAAVIGLLQGATALPGVAIVSAAFGFCSGASGVLLALARQARPH